MPRCITRSLVVEIWLESTLKSAIIYISFEVNMKLSSTFLNLATAVDNNGLDKAKKVTNNPTAHRGKTLKDGRYQAAVNIKIHLMMTS